MKCSATVLLISAIYLGHTSVFAYPTEPGDDVEGSGIAEDDGAGFDYDLERENASSSATTTTTTATTEQSNLAVEGLEFAEDPVEQNGSPIENSSSVNDTNYSSNSSINSSDGSVFSFNATDKPSAEQNGSRLPDDAIRGRSGLADDYEATNSRKEISELDEMIGPVEPSLDTIGTGFGPGRGDQPGGGFDYYGENNDSDSDAKDKKPGEAKTSDGSEDRSSRSRIEYHGYHWDQMGLLIFIILCIILLTILIFCCYIVRHMYDWAIIKVVKTSGDEVGVKYTVGHGQSREVVQLLNVSNLYVEPRVMDAVMLEKEKRELELGQIVTAQKQEVHRTTAHVEIGTGRETKFPAVTVLVRPQAGDKKPATAEAVMKQEWMADIFRTMETEPEQENHYNEVERLNQKKQQRMSSNIETRDKNLNHMNTKHSQSLENILNSNDTKGPNQEGLTFLEKFGVTNSRTSTIRATTVQTTKTDVSASSSSVLIVSEINKPSADQRSVSRSRDDLGDEDMNDYLEGYSGYPV